MWGRLMNFLWVSYLNGDKHAFDQLYRRYYPLLLHYGCKFSQDQNWFKIVSRIYLWN